MTQVELSRVVNTDADAAEAVAARDAIERILASAGFTTSERRRALLRYVVEQALAGRQDRLSAPAIAVAVLGRRADFDPQTDPIVRLEISRLRRDLDQYYREAGQDDPVRVTIPKGQYAPLFVAQDAARTASGSGAQAAGATQQPGGSPVAVRWPRRWRVPLITVLAILVPIAAVGLLQHSGDGVADAVRQQAGPAVVVHPFTAPAGDEDAALLAAGVTNELITDLARFDGLAVYAGAGAGAEGDAVAPVATGGAGFVVAGNVARDAERLHVSVRLAERESGRIVWSERYERSPTIDGLLALETELSAGIAAWLAQPYGIIHTTVARGATEARPATLFAYDCVQRALLFRMTSDRTSYPGVRQCLEESIRRDPGYADAWAMLAFAHLDASRFGMVETASREVELAAALSAAQRATRLAPDRVRGLQALAAARYMSGAFDEAERLQRRAIERNPNDPESRAQLGWRLVARGRAAEGEEMMQQAIDRSTRPPSWYDVALALALHLQGEPESALAAARQGASFCCGFGQATLAITEAAAGDPARARDALATAIRQAPVIADAPRAFWRSLLFAEDVVTRLNQGLAEAGLDLQADS
jgi:TolB-like protein